MILLRDLVKFIIIIIRLQGLEYLVLKLYAYVRSIIRSTLHTYLLKKVV